MNGDRLLPVLLAFGVLLSGVITVEVAARRHGPAALRIAIATNAELSEEESSETWQATLNDTHARARQLALRGDYADALTRYAEVVAKHPDSALASGEYGHWLRRAGKTDEALTVLEQARHAWPTQASIVLDLALLHATAGRKDLALSAFRQALELRPRHSATRVALGDTLRKSGSFDEAIAVLEPAAASGGNEERARASIGLGRAYIGAGRNKEARKAFVQAIERAPASAGNWVRVARGLLESKDAQDWQAAVEHATRASRLAPELAEAFSVVGRAQEQLGNAGAADDAFTAAARLEPSNTFARTRLLRLKLEQEEFAAARRIAETLLHLDAANPVHHFLAGLVEAKAGNVEVAREHYQRAIQTAKEPYAEAYFNLGLLERQVHEYKTALAAYEQATKARPDYEAAWNNIGLVQINLKDLPAAKTAFEKAIALTANYVPAWLNLGRVHSKQEKWADAVQAYQRVLQLAPEHRTARLKLAVAYRKLGNVEGAVSLYRELIAQHPRFVTARYNLGVALGLLGRATEARDAYQKALENDPNHMRSLKNLGLLETELEQPDAAHQHLTSALDQRPEDAEVRIKLAELDLGRGDALQCMHHARLVLTQLPRDPTAQTLLAKCSTNQKESTK